MSSTNTSCVATRMRNLDVTIFGRVTESPLVLHAMFSYECPDDDERTLNLGETVLLPREVNPFIDSLKENDITVTAIHNHWLFEKPRLMYVHWASVDEPICFAKKTAKAFQVLGGRIDE